MVTLIRASDSAIEVIKVTNITGTTWTIVRAQEGTTALNFAAGDKVELRVTAGFLQGVQAGRLLAVQRFETAGSFTYTRTPGARFGIVHLCGGLGGTSGLLATSASQISMCAPGLFGVFAVVLVSNLPASCSVVVGAGGTEGSSGTLAGGNGGDTSFGASTAAYCLVPGGKGGSVCTVHTTFPAVGDMTLSTSISTGSWGANATLLEYNYPIAGHFMYPSLSATVGVLGWDGGRLVWEPTNWRKIGPAFGSPRQCNGPSRPALAGSAGSAGGVHIYAYA